MMDIDDIKRRIEQATGATDVRVCGDGEGGYWMADFHSPNGGHVLNAQIEAAGFRQESLFYNGNGQWTAGVFDTQPAPGDGLPASNVKEGGGVLAEDDEPMTWDDDAAGMPTVWASDHAALQQRYDALHTAVIDVLTGITPQNVAMLWALTALETSAPCL